MRSGPRADGGRLGPARRWAIHSTPGRLLDPDDGPGGAEEEWNRLKTTGTMVWGQLIELDGGFALLRALGSLDADTLKGVVIAAVLHEKVAAGWSSERVLAWLQNDVPPEARPG